jgi:putative ATPase
MRQLGYGDGYQNPHEALEGHVPESYLPEALETVRFYEPTSRGFEGAVGQRLEHRRQQIRTQRQDGGRGGRER